MAQIVIELRGKINASIFKLVKRIRRFIKCEASQIAHELTMSGLEVESVEDVKPSFTNIKTVKIEKIDAHPNSDRLHLVTVNTGSGLKTVVCGAQNIQEEIGRAHV